MKGRSLVFQLYSLLIIGVIFQTVSCKRDPLPGTDPGVVDPGHQPTPYKLELPKWFSGLPMNAPASNPLTEEGVELGRRLFYDPILSGNDQQSCGTCHQQAAGFTDAGKQFSLGIDGLPGKRNTMALFNMGWEKRFFWDGGAKDLESQIVAPIVNPIEMHEDIGHAVYQLNRHPEYPELFRKAFGKDSITSNQIQQAIAQFLRIIISGETRFDAYLAGAGTLTPSELRGLVLFTTDAPFGGADCFHCHSLSTFVTDHEFHNNGLDSAFPPGKDRGLAEVTGRLSDVGKFKTPSLKNLVYTAPYMHDGRFTTLEEVIDFYVAGVQGNSPNLDPFMSISHRVDPQLSLTPQDKQDLIAFLKTMTDPKLLTNPKYSKP